MTDQQMTTKRALLVIGFLFLLIGISLVAPASWVGVKSSNVKRSPLVLKSADDLAVLTKDTNRNSNPDWKDLLLETTSSSTVGVADKYVVTEADKKRLADPNNMTASFSKNLYTVASYAKKNGAMTTAEQQAIVSGLITKETEKIEVTTYSIYDIKTSTTETDASRRAYGNDLGRVFKKAVGFKLDMVDFDKIQAYSKSKDPNTLATLIIKKNNAKTIIEELLKMTVPNSALPYHLLIINRLSQYAAVLEGITQAETDPVRATVAFNNFAPSIKALSAALENMRLYFKIEEITFTSNESGYVLTAGYTSK